MYRLVYVERSETRNEGRAKDKPMDDQHAAVRLTNIIVRKLINIVYRRRDVQHNVPLSNRSIFHTLGGSSIKC
jgi:hypothetical protein